MSYNDNIGCIPAILILLFGVLIWFVFSLIFAWPVMLLWNWLMPAIFNLPIITFWQSFGLMVLCSLLFKSTNTSSTQKS